MAELTSCLARLEFIKQLKPAAMQPLTMEYSQNTEQSLQTLISNSSLDTPRIQRHANQDKHLSHLNKYLTEHQVGSCLQKLEGTAADMDHTYKETIRQY